MYFPMFVVALLAAVATIQGYPTGAPPSFCDGDIPFHGVDPQPDSTFPYEIIVEKSKLNGGESTTLTIKGKEDQFRGFLIVARAGKERIGTFSAVNDLKSHTIDCGSGIKGNAITQSEASDKKETTVAWTAPENFSGSINFYVTVVKVFDKYWMGHKSSTVTVY